MKNKRLNLSVVIPTYKNKELFFSNLRENLPYLQGCEIIIVNDDPSDNLKIDLSSFHGFKKTTATSLIILNNQKNLGFGEAVNQGVKKAKNKYVMILNNDVKLIDDSYRESLKYFENNKKIFAVAFAQKEKDGSIVGKNRLFWQKGLFFHEKAGDLEFGETAWVEAGAGIFDREKFLALSGFDQLYSPFYWEDIDLCFRARKKGWVMVFDPSILVIHQHQSTIGRYFNQGFIRKIAFRNQFIFIWKNVNDQKLLFSHLFFLPYYFFYFLFKKDLDFHRGLLAAFKKIPCIIKKRRAELRIKHKELPPDYRKRE